MTTYKSESWKMYCGSLPLSVFDFITVYAKLIDVMSGFAATAATGRRLGSQPPSGAPCLASANHALLTTHESRGSSSKTSRGIRWIVLPVMQQSGTCRP